MIFRRSIPERKYSDYTRHRPLLRHDFQHRCAYCLTHEHFLGGESGFEIDHYRPLNGPYGRPDLKAAYTNLYWSCGECNSNKGDTWPCPEDYEQGIRFIDPCEPEGDHDLHWRFHSDGTIESLTPAGEYTAEKLLLWRPFLQARRAEMFRDQAEAQEIEEKIRNKEASEEIRVVLEQRLVDIKNRLEPPVYDRARRSDRPQDH